MAMSVSFPCLRSDLILSLGNLLHYVLIEAAVCLLSAYCTQSVLTTRSSIRLCEQSYCLYVSL